MRRDDNQIPRPAASAVTDAELTAAAAATLRTAGAPEITVVLGSGWRAAADALAPPAWRVAMEQVPGLAAPAAAGHGGEFRLLHRGGLRVGVFLGRLHYYEGYPPERVTRAVRAAVAAGSRVVILTNAAGGIDAAVPVGTPVLLRDHLNLTAASPLTGAAFTDLTSCYPLWLREVARAVDPTLGEGVYAGLRGPQFETPAEIAMLRRLGAQLVGMSTVLEAIAVAAAGAQLLGVSLVSNHAAGVSGQPLSAQEVLDAGQAALPRLSALLAGVVDRLAATPGWRMP